MDIKRITKEYYEQLCVHKFHNIDEADNVPKLMEGEINNPDRYVVFKELELIIDNFPNQKAPGPDWFTGEFY